MHEISGFALARAPEMTTLTDATCRTLPIKVGAGS
jgi:hypothetical protein